MGVSPLLYHAPPRLAPPRPNLSSGIAYSLWLPLSIPRVLIGVVCLVACDLHVQDDRVRLN